MYSLNDDNRMVPLLENKWPRRQDLPKIYALNGAVYVSEIITLLDRKSFVTEETVPYEMPRNRSLDIDTEDDLLYANTVLRRLS